MELKVKLLRNILYCKSDWITADHRELLSLAVDFLQSLPEQLIEVPWFVGSISKDIYDQPRTSPDHAAGLAIDISPCFSKDLVLPESMSTPGLAWNLMKMACLAKTGWNKAVWIVEGDHIHIKAVGPFNRTRNTAFGYLSLQPCYPFAQIAEKSFESGAHYVMYQGRTGSLLGSNVAPKELGGSTTIGDHILESLDKLAPVKNEEVPLDESADMDLTIYIE